MTTLDIVLVTGLATALLLVAGYFLCRAIYRVWTVLKDLSAAAKELAVAVKGAANVAGMLQAEIAYMRSITQGSPGQIETPPPVPPLGRAGTMPPFPTRDLSTYRTVPPEDAKPEDTDKALLEQDDQEMMAAQAREEMRASGIEPEEDEGPQPAVVEEA
jgi:hypothetical protein